jgi:CheY-like chemotaxis protein
VHKILVIDDDPTGTGLLLDLLRFAGHQGYPLVIMDVRLRVHDGLELLRQLRAHPDASVGGILVLMVSAEDVSASCRAAGASGFAEKPFDTESLFRTIQEIMEVSV